MVNRPVNIYFDMDGVLARWEKAKSVEDTYQKGYFLNLAPDEKMISLAIRLSHLPLLYNVRILSAVYDNEFALPEKKQWLIDHSLQGFELINTPIGADKADFIPDSDSFSILIDDYSPNLHAWINHKNCIGVKYYNGVNGSNGTWNGPSINENMGLKTMETQILLAIIDALKGAA